jgi:peroxidase
MAEIDQVSTMILIPVTLLLVAVTMNIASSAVEAQLVDNFYASHGCPEAESLVAAGVTKAIFQNETNAPGLLRMHFHDCFVNVGARNSQELLQDSRWDRQEELEFPHANMNWFV